MLPKFFRNFRGAGHTSGFDVYYRNLQREGVPGAPSVEEARQDYRRIKWLENPSWFLYRG